MGAFIWMNLFFILNVVTHQISGQRTINTVQIGDNKFFFSDTTPYSPRLNWFLAYQYCRNIGMDLMSFQTEEESLTLFDYLENNGKSLYAYWTSANQLGSPMWIWMTTGQPLNSTFHYWAQGGPPLSKSQNGCMKVQSKVWSAANCMDDLAFICQLTRCYYFDYSVTNQINSSQGAINSLTNFNSSPTPTTNNQIKLKPNSATQRKPSTQNTNIPSKPNMSKFPSPNVVSSIKSEFEPDHNQNAKIATFNGQPLGLSLQPPDIQRPSVTQNEIIPSSIPSLAQELTPPQGSPLSVPRDTRTAGEFPQPSESAARFQRKEQFSWAFAQE